MWNWLRSLWSGTRESSPPTPGNRDSGTNGPSASPVSRRPTPSHTPASPRPSSAPETPRPGLDWKPCESAAAEEPVLAPPLTDIPADQSPILGIDLGTTHSAVAVVRAGKVEIIPNQEGESLTPSVVAFTADGRVLVGSPAIQQAILNPHRTVSGIKRRLGRDAAREESSYEMVDHPEGPRVRIDGSFFTPAEVSALILGKLLAGAEAYLGRPARRAVLTVPASFDDAQRQSTLDAALLAGIDVQWVRENPRTGVRFL